MARVWFLLVHLAWSENAIPHERAMKWWTPFTKRQERNTSGYLSLEFHFHTDTRVRIWPSGSDWLISLQTRKSIWLVCFIGNTERMVGISVTSLLEVNFAYLYQGRKLFTKYFSISSHVQDSPAFHMEYVSDSVFKEILTLVLEKHFPAFESLTKHQKKALLAITNRKDVFFILPTKHWKPIIIQLLPMSANTCVLFRLFIPSTCQNFLVCPLNPLVDSYSWFSHDVIILQN